MLSNCSELPNSRWAIGTSNIQDKDHKNTLSTLMPLTTQRSHASRIAVVLSNILFYLVFWINILLAYQTEAEEYFGNI